MDLVFTGDVRLRAGKRRLLHDGHTARDDRLSRRRSCTLVFMCEVTGSQMSFVIDVSVSGTYYTFHFCLKT